MQAPVILQTLSVQVWRSAFGLQGDDLKTSFSKREPLTSNRHGSSKQKLLIFSTQLANGIAIFLREAGLLLGFCLTSATGSGEAAKVMAAFCSLASETCEMINEALRQWSKIQERELWITRKVNDLRFVVSKLAQCETAQCQHGEVNCVF